MPVRRRRSCLTVPGDDARKLAKAATIVVDEVILDLEDAVAAAQKDVARETVARALRDHDWRAGTVAIRVNRGSADDLALVREARPDIVVLPKVESPDELLGLPVPAEAQIETARGLVECERIAGAPGLEALVLGPGDLAASLGVPELTIGSGAHVEYALRPHRRRCASVRRRGDRRPIRGAGRLGGAPRVGCASPCVRLRRQVVHPPLADRGLQRGVRTDGVGVGARAPDPHERRCRATRRGDGGRGDPADGAGDPRPRRPSL